MIQEVPGAAVVLGVVRNLERARTSGWKVFERIHEVIEKGHLDQRLRIGRGWASVLKTQSSSDSTESSLNVRNMYFSVSARKKLCCTSSCPP